MLQKQIAAILYSWKTRKCSSSLNINWKEKSYCIDPLLVILSSLKRIVYSSWEGNLRELEEKVFVIHKENICSKDPRIIKKSKKVQLILKADVKKDKEYKARRTSKKKKSINKWGQKS